MYLSLDYYLSPIGYYYWYLGYYFKGNNNQPQLTLSVTNKLYVDVVHYMTYFGGAIYFDKAQNGYYK